MRAHTHTSSTNTHQLTHDDINGDWKESSKTFVAKVKGKGNLYSKLNARQRWLYMVFGSSILFYHFQNTHIRLHSLLNTSQDVTQKNQITRKKFVFTFMECRM